MGAAPRATKFPPRRTTEHRYSLVWAGFSPTASALKLLPIAEKLII